MPAMMRKWLFFSIFGLLLIGAGLSLAIDAGFHRLNSPHDWNWMYYGTFALVVFNSGICCFGQGIIYKMKLDNKMSK